MSSRISSSFYTHKHQTHVLMSTEHYINVKRDLYTSKETYTSAQQIHLPISKEHYIHVKRDLYTSKETYTSARQIHLLISKEMYTTQIRPTNNDPYIMDKWHDSLKCDMTYWDVAWLNESYHILWSDAQYQYGVATISRLLKIICLFDRI